jgi:hypothetical protein
MDWLTEQLSRWVPRILTLGVSHFAMGGGTAATVIGRGIAFFILNLVVGYIGSRFSLWLTAITLGVFWSAGASYLVLVKTDRSAQWAFVCGLLGIGVDQSGEKLAALLTGEAPLKGASGLIKLFEVASAAIGHVIGIQFLEAINIGLIAFLVCTVIIFAVSLLVGGITVTDFQPGMGTGGIAMLVQGQGFGVGDTVELGTQLLGHIRVASDGTAIAGVVPPAAAGTQVPVSVGPVGGTRATATGQFRYT